MRVLSLSCVYPRPQIPNFGTFVRRRLQGLARDAEVKVVAPVGPLDYAYPSGNVFGNAGLPQKWMDGPIEVLHPRWLYPPGGNFLNPALLAAQLRGPLNRLRREFPYELIDAHFGYPDGIAAARLAHALGVPYMVTLRGNETMHCRNSKVRARLAVSLRGAARVIAVSEALREFAISLGTAPERARTIPNGIDKSVFFRRDRIESRRALGYYGSERLVLSAGSLIERKGHHHAIEAVADLRLRGIDARLLIAGAPGREGSFSHTIRSTVDKCGLANHVAFLGELSAERLAIAMSAADVLCLASSREGWPNVVHEALGCGTPVVATNVGAVPDMLASAERGTIVLSSDPKVLGGALLGALERAWDHSAISQWAHSRSWENVADEVLTQMRQVVSEARSADCAVGAGRPVAQTSGFIELGEKR